MKGSKHHRVHAGLTFLVAVAAGVFLIPLLRSQPKAIHDFATELHDWQRISFAFLLCVIFTYTMFKLFSPRLVHLRYWWTHPPTWFAWLLGLIVVAAVDVALGLHPKGYRGTWQEWVGYAGGAIVLVAVYRLCSAPQAKDRSEVKSQDGLRLENIEDAKWEDIEVWLRSDAPADYDFLGNRTVAERLASMLMNGTRSIGIVGPYGAGKTSIVKWMIDGITARNSESQRLFVSEHSCWAFENSASSIHEMLAGAIKTVESEIDTFHVSSLPESYRQTFSAGGEWIDTISNLVLGKRDPSEQFAALSELLGELNARLVFVIEDLDRNDTRSFDIQEVAAFLQQLKEHDNLSFVLTGGLSPSRQIDFAKLCVHIEYLRSIETNVAMALATRVSEKCLDATEYPHEPLGAPDRQHLWSPLSGLLMRDYEELSLPQAVASLLNTPRSLRHALGRTLSAWHTLFGEIDLDHLLAVNVLRFGAPECFVFLVRRWDRLHSPPASNPSFGAKRIEQIRKAIVEDWNNTIQNIEWNSAAALVVMEFILPATELWLVDSSKSVSSSDAVQGIQHERYWRRAVNEAFDPAGVKDQDVIRDLVQWLESPRADAQLITQLISSSAYSDLWEDLAGTFVANQPDQILLVCEHVLSRIMEKEGSVASRDSQGFVSTWRFANPRVDHRPENQKWLEARITEAAYVSIELVNGLWHFYGTPGQYSIVRHEDSDAVRQHVLQILRSILVDGASLIARLSPKYSATLYQLVFDPGNEGTQTLNDVASWRWLGPILLDALRQGNDVAAAGVASLVATRSSGSRGGRWEVEPDVLFGFFSNDTKEVVELLSKIAVQTQESDQQPVIHEIVESARIAIEEQTSNAEGGDSDVK